MKPHRTTKSNLRSMLCGVAWRVAGLLTLAGPVTAQNVAYQPTLSSPSATNLSLPVGTVKGDLTVSPTGAAVYNIPLTVAPGTRGVEPKLSLVYSSQGGNGQLGWGWNLSGLSAISRVGPDNYHDGRVAPVEWNNNDFYSLDGARLTMLSGGGGSGSVFATESETWAKIESQGWTGSGPAWFKVWLKDGTIQHYGEANNSRVMNNAGTEVLAWKLSKIVDVNGNYADYHYTTDGDEHRINEIWYTGSIPMGALPYNRVKFNYALRNDPNLVFEAGSGYHSRHLLTQIEMYADAGQFTRRYNIGYRSDGIHSFLQTVEECGANGGCFNNNQFIYGGAGNEMTYTDVSGLTNSQGGGYRTMSGDFNGDGWSDVVQMTQALNGNVQYTTGLEVKLRSPSGNTFYWVYNYPLQTSYQYTETKSPPNSYNYHFADYDGDGTDDILIAHRNGNVFTKATIISKLQYSFPNVNDYYPPSGFSTVGTAAQCIFPGDYDGDGRVDFITTLSNGTGYKVFITCPFRGIFNQEVIFPAGSVPNTYYNGSWIAFAELVAPIDMDGDNRSELLYITTPTNGIPNSYTYVFNFVQQANGSWQANKVIQSGYPTCWHSVLFGDFNGDKKTDMLTRTNDGTNRWEIAISTGRAYWAENISFGFNPKYRTQANNWKSSYDDDPLLLSDFDGDGKTDLCHLTFNFNTQVTTFNKFYSKGKNAWVQNNSNVNGTTGYSHLAADFSGDGKADILGWLSSGSTGVRLFTFRDNPEERLLKTVRDGIGSQTPIAYKSLTNYDPSYNTNFYGHSGNTDYPFNNIKASFYAVSSIWMPTGNNTSNRTTYRYYNLRFHKGGKGILGFESVEAIDNGKMMVKAQGITNWNTTYFIPQRTTETIMTISGSLSNPTYNSVGATTQDYTITGIGGFRYKHLLTNTTSYDLLMGSNTNKTFQFDNNGNETQAVALISAGSNQIEVDSIVTTYAPASTTKTPVPGRPATMRHSHRRIPMNAISTTTTYNYANGNITDKTEYAGLANSLTTYYTQNSTGNTVSEETIWNASPLNNRSVYTTWDPKGRFEVTKSNVYGQTVTSSSYDARWGAPLSQTELGGLTTTYGYDEFGRTTSTTVPDGYTITRDRYWETYPGSPNRYGETIYHPGHGWSFPRWDAVGHETETYKSLWGGASTSGQLSVVVKTYDALGRLRTETTPHFGSESYLTTTHAYDYLGRLSSSSNALGATTYGYSYVNNLLRVETTDPAGRVSAKRTDAAERLIASKTEGGEIIYNYDSWGNVRSTAIGSYTTTTNYDDYNRRVYYYEPSNGAIRYTYNGFGDVVSQTDASNHVTTITYDLLGRQIQRVGAEGATTYSYYSGVAGAGNKIRKITGFNNGPITDYAYTATGRVASMTETINGQVNTTAYTYDGYGRIETVQYPNNGPLITNQYNIHGLLTGVYHGSYSYGNLVYEVTGVNGMGQVTNAERDNGRSTTNTYLYNTPTRFSTPGVQDYQLSYDWAAGLITARQDALKGSKSAPLRETFAYDNASRLTSSSVVNPWMSMVPQVITYGTGPNADNIVEKSDIGQFKYNVSKQHAIWYADNSQSQIPVQTQDIVYTAFNRPDNIEENGWKMQFEYGADYQRRRTLLYQNNILEETREYFGSGSERHTDAAGNVRDIYYVPGPEGVALIVLVDGSGQHLYYPYQDHLGTITALTDQNGTVVCEQAFDPWGRRRDPMGWTVDDNALPAQFAWLRGFTNHEHLPQFRLINMNARLYDPLVGRMLGPDNYLSDPHSPLAYNRFSYALNNPMSHIDPDGNFAFLPIIIAAVVFGGVNLGVQAANGEINNFWDGVTAFGTGAIAGAAIATGVSIGVGIPVLGTIIKGAGIVYGATAAAGVVVGTGHGLLTGDWSRLENTGKILAGSFYLDKNRTFFGQVWQGISRFSWELVQTTVGQAYSQVRNASGGVDRVDYFGGATFSTGENRNTRKGVSIGNNINVWLRGELPAGDFQSAVLADPIYMHEYGHTFDSQIFGPAYLFGIGIPSAAGANWTEIRANRFAKHWFGKHFGVDWNRPYIGVWTIEDAYPTK